MTRNRKRLAMASSSPMMVLVTSAVGRILTSVADKRIRNMWGK